MRIPFYGSAALDFNPGHYWLEIDHGDPKIRESYGWYPVEDITNAPLAKKIKALPPMFSPHLEVDGCINGESPQRRASQREYGRKPVIAGGGIGTTPFPWDPYQGTSNTQSIRNPYVRSTDNRSDEQIIDEIRHYASNYNKTSNGKWTFKFDDPAENNCHTFVWQSLFHCHLIDVDINNIAVDPHFTSLLMERNCPEYVESLRLGAKELRHIIEKKHGKSK